MTAPVCVIIPTFRRPESLARAVQSVFAQTGCPPFQLVVADNDPDGSADEIMRQLFREAPETISCLYLHVPEPGVANVRNAALAATGSTLIAFLDDDQSAPANWLAALLACSRDYPAAVIFGPVNAVLPKGDHPHAAYLTDFFSRRFEQKTGFSAKSFGCGNSLLNLSLVPAERPVFDMRTNETGGEDDLLFGRIRAANGRFAWCAEAPVFEHVLTERATLAYTLRRAMAYGQGPITLARRSNPPNWPLVAGWMIVGAYKVVVNAILYGAGWLSRRPDRAHHLDRAARGFGKLIWWRLFRFYGAARL